LAEDNKINQKVALKLLEREGYHVELAENGSIAFSMLQKNKYDLILMDIQMPVMSGLEASYAIRDQEKSFKNKKPIPIIAFSANANKEDRAKYKQAGMDGFLAKPFKIDDLRQELARFV